LCYTKAVHKYTLSNPCPMKVTRRNSDSIRTTACQKKQMTSVKYTRKPTKNSAHSGGITKFAGLNLNVY
jgi:hypothetical protein